MLIWFIWSGLSSNLERAQDAEYEPNVAIASLQHLQSAKRRYQAAVFRVQSEISALATERIKNRYNWQSGGITIVSKCSWA